MGRNPYIASEALPFLLMQAVTRSSGNMTRKQICEALGRKKSPHILDLIQSLVVDGWLTVSQSTLSNGVTIFHYTATDKARVWFSEGGLFYQGVVYEPRQKI